GKEVARGGTEKVDLLDKPIPRSVSIVLPFAFEMTPAAVEGVYWFDVQFKGESLGGAALRVTFRKEGG
ncbi:MAG TPA: hypothetical protein VFV34_09285, partial [Blastocatellia bacterium]|nr:hypothetical protein [Blastocatellia bacterium]